ncbi:MAG: phage tail tape measure protein, partial [Planctomycetota bacterium]
MTDAIRISIVIDPSDGMGANNAINASTKAAFKEMQQAARAFGKAADEMYNENQRKARSSFKSTEKAAKDAAKETAKAWKDTEHSLRTTFSGIKSYAMKSMFAIRDFGWDVSKQFAQIAMKLSVAFETGLAEVSTLLTGDIGPQMEYFSSSLLALSERSSQSLIDLTKGAYQAISSGITTSAQTMEVVKNSAMAATGGLTTTARTVDVVTTAMNIFGKETGSSSAILSQMFRTVVLAKTNFQQLASSFGTAASAFGAAKVPMHELLAAFTAMTKAGQKPHQAMTFLLNLILKLQRPSEASGDLFRKLGISYGSAALEAKGLAGIMDEVREKTKGNSQALVELFPNNRAYRAAVVLATSGTKNFKDALVEIKGAVGDHEVAFSKMADTVQVQWNMAMDKGRSILIEIGKEVLPLVKEKLYALNQWFVENKKQLIEWGT